MSQAAFAPGAEQRGNIPSINREYDVTIGSLNEGADFDDDLDAFLRSYIAIKGETALPPVIDKEQE